ncbi:MAG: DUF1311 domain-containing protein [Alphaproteobacteria bacterium]|nr:DUF1311 domain-containing protein [Alphaproteobacteria bacterium]
MLVAFVGFALFTAQDLNLPMPRPAVECSSNMTNPRAMRDCLQDLLRDAERDLDAAVESARQETQVSDLDSGGMFDAAGALERAQDAWSAYRDAECARRGALMFIGEDQRDQLVLDCQVTETRARTRELQEM